MVGIKRKDAPSGGFKDSKKQRIPKDKQVKLKQIPKQRNSGEEDEEDFGGFSGDDSAGDDALGDGGEVGEESEQSRQQKAKPKPATKQNAHNSFGSDQFKLDTSSAEAHAKQRALAKERKSSKPNADAIQRSKKIWERLRRKSHVPLDERKQLVAELFDIISGRVRDFVFKHDSVRVIQCALKYASQQQRRLIVRELKGDVRTLAESRYGKFLVAKMVAERDDQIRDAVIPEFYGHVRRLLNHPEASWIVDDVYRQIATPPQKATMLREWYGAEFALFHRNPSAKQAATVTNEETADLRKMLALSPEKRKPILQYLLQMINSLIQKKMTGFTMLHDAMLQYFLALAPGSEEHAEFLEILKGDIDPDVEGGGGDLFRNLAFTKSGARLVCLALAYGSAKDRKIILRCFKDTVEMMAFDTYGHTVLLVALDVSDDTKMISKSIFYELFGENVKDDIQRLDRLESLVTNLNARLPVLYPMAGLTKWLVNEQDKFILEEVHEIRKATSKKTPEVRRRELLEQLSAPVLEIVGKRAEKLVQSSFGCQVITETLLEANGELKDEAKAAVAQLAAGNPVGEGHIARNAAAGRMLKTLVMGGNFDPTTTKVKLVEPRLNFGAELYAIIKDHVVRWACSDSSFVVVGLLESEDVPDEVKMGVDGALRKGKKEIEITAKGAGKVDRDANGAEDGSSKEKPKSEGRKGNPGARILLEKIG